MLLSDRSCVRACAYIMVGGQVVKINNNLIEVEKLELARRTDGYWEVMPRQKVYLNIKAVVSLEPEYNGEIYYIRTRGNDGIYVSGQDCERVKSAVANM